MKKRISARLHMSVICIGTIASGILASKGMLWLGLPSPMLRYGIAVVVSYAVFFALVYTWLRWHFDLGRKKSDFNALDAADLVDIPLSLPRSGPSGSAPAWGGKGGQFGGGGTSSSWAEGKSGPSLGSSSSGSSVFDSLGDADEAAVLILLVIVVLAVTGSAVFLVYQAPEILFEAAFEAILVAGLVKQAKKAEAEGWARTIFRKTWYLFLAVLLAALALGWLIRHQCPEARSFGEYRELCAK